jgi:hypothetical protein
VGNTGQISDLECPRADSHTRKSILNFVVVESVDEIITCLQASIGTFCLFIETIFSEKKCGNDIHEPMLRFGNKMFSKSNEKVQCNAQINIQKLRIHIDEKVWLSHLVNSATFYGNNSAGPLNINVEPFFHFTFCIFFSFIPFKSLLECRNLIDTSTR